MIDSDFYMKPSLKFYFNGFLIFYFSFGSWAAACNCRSQDGSNLNPMAELHEQLRLGELNPAVAPLPGHRGADIFEEGIPLEAEYWVLAEPVVFEDPELGFIDESEEQNPLFGEPYQLNGPYCIGAHDVEQVLQLVETNEFFGLFFGALALGCYFLWDVIHRQNCF
jgi:hypothetical protein